MMPVPGSSNPHLPVLYHEVISALNPHSSGRYIDGTVGAGGHAAGILDNSNPNGKLLGLDLDPVALDLAKRNLDRFGERFILQRASYTKILKQMEHIGWSSVHGILLDLGVSSMQLDIPQKGFSFRLDGPLDMRFDPENSVTAANLVNDSSVDQLADIIWRYGEDRHARKIAHAIYKERPFFTTSELAGLIQRISGSQKRGIHPATRTFQALRIAVNKELEAIEMVLPDIIQALLPGGRAAIISFHSLEDRIVKQYFKRESVDCICPPRQPVCTCNHRATIRIIGKLIRPVEMEAKNNPRARSAKLRIVEKLA